MTVINDWVFPSLGQPILEEIALNVQDRDIRFQDGNRLVVLIERRKARVILLRKPFAAMSVNRKPF
jgi:hypothetical protein